MGIKLFYAVPLLFAASVCNAATAGIVSLNMSKGNHVYALHRILPKERVYLQYPGKSGTAQCCIAIRGKSLELVEPDDAASDMLNDGTVFRYRLTQPPRLTNRLPFIGVTIVGNAIKVEQTAGRSLKVKLSDGVLTVRSCTSQEGLHVVGKLGARPASDLYLGFNYEVESPTCVP